MNTSMDVRSAIRTVTTAEQYGLIERLRARATSQLMSDQPEQRHDLWLAACLLQELMRDGDVAVRDCSRAGPTAIAVRKTPEVHQAGGDL